ncbi:DUF2070 family protein [Methanobrevibacter filiformis]|uniref:DUF2070 domain-containing protein n=1 Tax=Methanobrevibacter filiformis TaxID=55758 RepID=A0A165ZH79_9EURY|nr:DUF2070 family protein [Methanobrevibacter filiformis]KZX10712.1 hypothetical protein MBFIL_16240 [Methanobrevibacter filiformis]
MSSMSSVAGLSKYLKTLPNTKISTFSMIFISFIAGTIVFLIDPTSKISFLEKIIYGGTFGFGLLGISSIMSGAIVQQWVSSMKGINLKNKHSMFLSLLSMIILAIIMIIGAIISAIFKIDLIINSIIFGSVLIYAFIILVLWSTSSIGFFKSGIVACFQPILTICMLIVITVLGYAGKIPQFGIISLLLKVIIANIIFGLAIFSFIKVIESPLKKNLGIGLLELLSLFIAHINDGSNSVEKLFEEIGEPIDTLVGIISFKVKDKEKNTNTKNNADEIKTLFISPCVHPGPLGVIGGANMPSILPERFNNFTMVAHGPSTHDFNPVSSKEIDKIESTVKEGIEEIEYSENASKFIRYSEKKAKIGVQFFNDSMILLSTFAPHGSDDIEFGIGLSMMLESKAKYNVKNSIIVDCHNSFDEESGRVLPGNPEVFQMLDAINKIKKEEQNSGIKVGCHSNLMKTLNKHNGVGDTGVKVMVIEVQNQRTGYILFDSNNMKRGFREKIIKEIEDLDLNEVEVMTTDTHSVNTLSNGYNPIGLSEQDKIIEYTKDTVKKAIDDLEPVEAGAIVKRIRNINTFGPNNSIELVSTISSIVAVSKITAPLIFILAIILVFIWIFYL